MSAYCTVQDLFSYGLPRGALANPARLAASVSASANAFSLDQHGFALNDQITVRADSLGGALPAPLVAGVTYYAIPLNASAFSVAATPGGAAIDLTTNGTRVLVTTPTPDAAAIAWATAIVDDMLPAHIVPLVAPYPPIVTMTVAELAVGKLVGITGSSSKSIGEMVDAARKRLERWSNGIPLRGENVPAHANTAVSATAPYRDCRGWSRWGGL